jgi:hypothetical protein
VKREEKRVKSKSNEKSEKEKNKKVMIIKYNYGYSVSVFVWYSIVCNVQLDIWICKSEIKKLNITKNLVTYIKM